jgi:malonate transporter and related proteins
MSHVILMALTPVFFVMALGYVAGRWHIVENHHVSGLNALVMSFAVPASLFVATASAPRSEMIAQAPLIAILGADMLIVYLLGYLFLTRLARASTAEASLQALTIAFPNLAGVGLPMVSALLGPTETVPVAVALATGSILLSPPTLILLELSSGKEKNDTGISAAQMSRALWHALTKPVVVAPILGILLSLSGLDLDSVTAASLNLIGQAAGGVALFLTGLILSAQPFRLDWKVVCATAASDVMRPLLAAAIVYIFPVSSEIVRGSILLAAVPSGFFGILFAETYQVRSHGMGSTVIASTVFSILTLAITIGILFPQ